MKIHSSFCQTEIRYMDILILKSDMNFLFVARSEKEKLTKKNNKKTIIPEYKDIHFISFFKK